MTAPPMTAPPMTTSPMTTSPTTAPSTTAAATPLRVLYFAWLRERMGRAEEALPVPDGVADVAGLVAWLAARDAAGASAFAAPDLVRAAVNQDFAAPDTPVRPGDEVALFPPVTGG